MLSAPRLVMVALLAAVPLWKSRAQGAQIVRPAPEYHATWFGARDGLPGEFITAIAQAQDGRLWVVASGTIARFDGQRFTLLELPQRPNPSSGPMAPSPVRLLASGGRDSMWIALQSGAMVLRSIGLWRTPHTTPQPVAGLVVPQQGAPVWLAGSDSALVGQGSNWRWAAQARTGLSADLGVMLAIEANGTPWVAERGGQWAFPVPLPLQGGGTDTTTLVALNEHQLPLARGRFVIAPANKAPLGVREYRDVLEVVDAVGLVHARIPATPDAVPLLLTHDGRLLVRHADRVAIYGAEFTPVSLPLPAAVSVTALHEDREGALWIGTSTQGVLRLRRRLATTYRPAGAHQSMRVVRTIVQGQGNAPLVIGRQLHRVRNGALVALPTPANVTLFSALETNDATLLLGYVDASARSYLHVERAGRLVARHAATGAVRRILIDEPRDRIVWLETERYCTVPRVAPATAPRCTSFGDWDARDLLIARDGRYWIAGLPGVLRHGPTDTTEYTVARGYLLANARALHEDADGTLWIGTYTHGLARLRGDTLRLLTREQGLAENVVSTMLEDDDGTLWMGGNLGVHGVNRRAASALLDGHAVHLDTRTVGIDDGLDNPEGSGWAGLRDRDGQLWFPTFDGAAVLPARAPDWARARPGHLTIEAITAGAQPLAVRDTVRMPPGVRELTLEAAAVSLRRIRPEVIEYRLEGHEAQWRPATSARTVHLPELRPGRWRLDIRTVDQAAAPQYTMDSATSHGADTDGAHSAAQSLILDVPHHWYERWWLQLLLGIATVAGGAWGSGALRRATRSTAQHPGTSHAALGTNQPAPIAHNAAPVPTAPPSATTPDWASQRLRETLAPRTASDALFLDHLHSVIRTQLANPDFDALQMAQQLGVSRSSLYRRVRELLDMSPMDLSGELRMEHAARLLRTTSLPIGVIALRVGFRNPSHFARRFTAVGGVSPTVYRSSAPPP